MLAEAREKTGLPIVVEIMSQVQLDMMVKYVDVLQVGARNMQNFNLLRAIGETRIPVLLKRGLPPPSKNCSCLLNIFWRGEISA